VALIRASCDVARLPLQTNARAGTINLVNGYRTAATLQLGQVYRTRPKELTLPSAYIDRISESSDSFTREESQRTVTVALRIVWGQTYGGDAVDQRDRFVDGFYAHVMDNPDAFGANAVIYWRTVGDTPDWTPEWLADVGPYYMTEITLEGFATT
jgi:hypothetical protein